MIKEFAIDPEFAANVLNMKLISALFDYHKPRRVSKFPKKWEAQVYQNAARLLDLDKKRIEEKLKQLKVSRSIISSGRSFDSNKGWCANAVDANTVTPFHAIMSDAGVNGFINSTDFDAVHPLVQLDEAVRVKKSLSALNNIFMPVLTKAKTIRVVDPYFSLFDSNCCKLFKHWFSVLNNRSDALQITISICTSADRNGGPYHTGDEGTLLAALSSKFHTSNLDSGLSVRLVPHTQDMHARYLLTDLASFTMDHSFSVDDSATANVHMLLLAQNDDVIRQYFS